MKRQFKNLRIFLVNTWVYIKTHTWKENRKRFMAFLKLQVIFLLRLCFKSFTKWVSVPLYESMIRNMYKATRVRYEFILAQSDPIKVPERTVKKGKSRVKHDEYYVVFVETREGKIKAVLQGDKSYVTEADPDEVI